MKTVKHQGELVTFQIPDQWAMESEPDGTAVFFDPSDESLTLRLTVLTIQSPRDLGPDDAETVIHRSGLPIAGSPEKLPNGQAVALSEVHHATERDTPIELHSVLVARVVPPRTARLANFTITAVPSVNQAGPMEPRLDAIKTWVRACTISDAPPQAPGGWWKRLFGGEQSRTVRGTGSQLAASAPRRRVKVRSLMSGGGEAPPPDTLHPSRSAASRRLSRSHGAGS